MDDRRPLSAPLRREHLPWHYGPRAQAKAIVGALVALCGGMATAYADGGATAGEVWATIGAGLATYGTVFGVGER